MQTTHTNKSWSRGKNHISHEENARNMQKRIDHLKRSLRHEHKRQAPSNFDYSSNDEEDQDYRQSSRTPPLNLSCMTKITAIVIEATIRLREAW